MVVVWNVVQCGICSLCQPLSYWLRRFTHKEWLNCWLKLLCILFQALVPRRWYCHENTLDWAASHLYIILCFEFFVLCILYTHRVNEHYWITYSSKPIAVCCSCKSIALHVIYAWVSSSIDMIYVFKGTSHFVVHATHPPCTWWASFIAGYEARSTQHAGHVCDFIQCLLRTEWEVSTTQSELAYTV